MGLDYMTLSIIINFHIPVSLIQLMQFSENTSNEGHQSVGGLCIKFYLVNGMCIYFNL